ncbi:MAG: hypothetical protein JO224_02455 [Pelomonas sp.]|nr:hypothetical protein [Roseateles sp.]
MGSIEAAVTAFEAALRVAFAQLDVEQVLLLGLRLHRRDEAALRKLGVALEVLLRELDAQLRGLELALGLALFGDEAAQPVLQREATRLRLLLGDPALGFEPGAALRERLLGEQRGLAARTQRARGLHAHEHLPGLDPVAFVHEDFGDRAGLRRRDLQQPALGHDEPRQPLLARDLSEHAIGEQRSAEQHRDTRHPGEIGRPRDADGAQPVSGFRLHDLGAKQCSLDTH